jgi:cell division protein FtsW
MRTLINTERSGTDHLFTASVFLLLGLGLVTLYSSSYAFAQRNYRDGLYFMSKQGPLGLIGIIGFFVASVINLEQLRRFIKPLVLMAGILCVLTLVPGIGVTRYGSARWIGYGGFTFQPSELVKLVLPLYLAHLFDKKRENIDSLSRGIIPPVIISGLFFVLILGQNDFSTAAFLAVNALFMFYLAGIKFRYLLSAFVMFVPIVIFLIFRKEHRLMRFISFLNPGFDPQGANFQVDQSVNAIISGGFWGKGLGQGTDKIASIPEIQSDFIFSAYAEEAGFLGVTLFYLLFAIFAIRGYMASMRSERSFNRLLGTGLVTMIVSQALMNIAVVAGALPATGIPLPFFSAGGSSLVVTMAMAGLIVNVSGQPSETSVSFPGEKA